MTIGEIRSKYLAFFKERGHVVIPAVRLVPENDPTTLFVSSGMQPLLPYFLGEPHPEGTRVVNVQPSFRAEDIEEIGDNRHTSAFEMLGNWSFGDYFKKEQLPWFFEFLTDVVGLDPQKLYVTVFMGDSSLGIPKDTESIAVWKEIFEKKGIEARDVEIGTEENGYEVGMKDARIFAYDAKKNWWSRSGVPSKMPSGEPGGPDSEVFYDFGTPHDAKWGTHCHPNCDCGRFMEIGNCVFMEYLKNADGSFSKLPKANVDFGGGLERIAAASVGKGDIFLIDTLYGTIKELERASGKKYEDASLRPSFRIVADHTKGAVFMIADGVTPSNTEQGYILRRLIRRSIRHMDKIGARSEAVGAIIDHVALSYRDHYPKLEESRGAIRAVILEEEERFRRTLAQGMKEFEKLARSDISGMGAFILFSSYGFPVELTMEIAKEKGIAVDLEGYTAEMKKHQQLSRAGAEQKFKGGLADSHEKTVKLHTAHHLLLRALQIVLGEEVKQRGSNITQERLRIDFSYPSKMTKEQLAEVERIVNEKINEDLPVIRSELSREDAEKLGAEHEFGQQYGERVSIYSVGPKGATLENPQFGKRFSIEFCGGPHVTHTGELKEGGKRFKIQKEEAVAAGVRRIKAVLE